MSQGATPGRALAMTVLGVVVLLTAAIPSMADPVVLYVSREGKDEWSGRKPETQAPDGPFATLGRAQEELRRLKVERGLPEGAEVRVLPGLYYLAETLQLGPEDSGAEGAPVVYRGWGEGEVILAGGQAVAGFQPYKGEIVQCDMKALGLGNIYFRQLFFKEERQTLARYPNADAKDPHQGTWAYVSRVHGEGNRREFIVSPEVRLAQWSRPQEGQVCIHPYFDWAWSIVPIAEVDPVARKISLGANVAYDLHVGDRYFVQNIFEELDAPGEWYLDKQTGTLYFWPPSALSESSVIVPTVQTVVEVNSAQWITLRGFTIEVCEGDAVRVLDSDDCLVAQNVVRNCGAAGIVVSGGHRSGARGNNVYACGRTGISITGGDRKTLERGENFADNNYIHYCGVFVKTYHPGVSVNGVGNTVSHNLIHDTPHAGLLLGGNDNVVEYNIVHHCNLESADTGGIYFCSRDWTQRGNVIRHNIFHHCGGFGKTNSWAPVKNGKVEFAYPHFTWGIYLDDPTTGTLVYGNILYKVPVCALHNHGGRDNTWENNIIIDAPALQAGMLAPNWSEWPAIYERLKAVRYPGSPYLKAYPELANIADTHPEEMSRVRFLRNIVYYTAEGTEWIRRERGAGWGGENCMALYSTRQRPEDFAVNEWDYNLIYAAAGLELRIDLNLTTEGHSLLTWDQWRERGKDQHSQLGDPLFVDPANNDFRLRPNSPALALGFKPIPVEKIGPYQDELRTTWPIVEAPGASALGDFTTRYEVELPDYARVEAKQVVTRSGLGNVLAKRAAGEPVTVAYFGGGIHPADGWRKSILEWFRVRSSQVTEVDASICDCSRGSGFSVYRFQHDVLAHNPDLVVVDFASDDYQTDPGSIMAAIEGVVRQARRANPKLDILFVYAFRASMEKDYMEGKAPYAISAYERIADHYGIPSINMGMRVAQLFQQGKLLIQGTPEEAKAAGKLLFSADGVRPLADGNRIYSEALTAGLDVLLDQGAKPVNYPLPPPYEPRNLERATLAPITQDMLSGEWRQLPDTDPLRQRFARHFDTIWFTDKPGAKLTFRFKGTDAGFFHLIGPDTGQVRVTIDDKDLGVRRQVDRWCYYQRLSALSLASGLSDEVHTVTVELLPDPPNRTEPIEEAKRVGRYEETLFQGVALRIGFLRVVGEVLLSH